MADLQQTLILIHGYIRWFILSLAVVGIARSFVSLFTREAKFMRLDAGLSAAYSGILDAQGLIGILLVFVALTLGETPPWAHALIMLPAIIIGHLARRFRQRPDRVRHQAQLGIFIGSLILVALGLLVIGELKLP
jgi:hypothetical protein